MRKVWRPDVLIIDGRGVTALDFKLKGERVEVTVEAQTTPVEAELLKQWVGRKVKVTFFSATHPDEDHLHRLPAIEQDEGQTDSESEGPPSAAQFLLSVAVPTDRASEVLGDLQEEYTDRVERCGLREARRWYWSQTVRSLWPLARRQLVKVVIEALRLVT